jgi:hypothetical protein
MFASEANRHQSGKAACYKEAGSYNDQKESEGHDVNATRPKEQRFGQATRGPL